MMPYQIYDLSSGMILWTYDGPNPDEQATDGRGVIAGDADQLSQYVDIALMPHMIVTKPQLGAVLQGAGGGNVSVTLSADGNSVARITGIPPGTTVMVSGPVMAHDVVDDGDYELTFDYPGDYTIRLTHPIRLPQEFVVHAA